MLNGNEVSSVRESYCWPCCLLSSQKNGRIKKKNLQKLKGPDFSELDIKLVPDPPSDVAK